MAGALERPGCAFLKVLKFTFYVAILLEVVLQEVRFVPLRT